MQSKCILHLLRRISSYPKGKNYIVCPLMDKSYMKRYGSLRVTIRAPAELK